MDLGLVGVDAGAGQDALVDADQREYPPRRLVHDSQFALQLLRRDAITSVRHKVHGVEPQMRRRG